MLAGSYSTPPLYHADYLWDVVTNTVLMVEITGFCFYASHKSSPLIHCYEEKVTGEKTELLESRGMVLLLSSQ